MKRKNIVEAIEKFGKDTESVNQFNVISEVKPENIKLQAVAPVSYVAAVEQSEREKDKFVKMIDDKTKNAQGLDNKDEDKFKHMNKSTGKSDLKVDQSGLKKMHLDESLFEFIDEEYAPDGYKEVKSILDRLGALAKEYNCDIWDFNDIVDFKVQGSLKDIDKFEEAYEKEFKAELEEYADTEHYANESLNESLTEGVQEDDGWNEDEISELEHWSVLGEISDLIYEIKNIKRGYYSKAHTADELGQYIKSLADQLDSFGDEVIALGDTEDIEESLNEDADDYIHLTVTLKDKDDGSIYTENEKIQEYQYYGNRLDEDEEALKEWFKDYYDDEIIKIKASGWSANESLSSGEKLQESDWSDRYFKWSKSTQAKLDKIMDAGLFDDLELDVLESEDEDSPLNKITRFYNEDGWAVTKGAYGGPNEAELKEISKALYDLINSYYKKAISKNESLKQPLKEATIISDVTTFNPWNKAVPTYSKIKEADKLNDLEAMIEEMYPDGIEAQTLNDLLAYDVEFLEGMLNIDLVEEE